MHRDVGAVLIDLREQSADQIREWHAVKMERYQAKLQRLDAAIDSLESSWKLAALVNAWVKVDEAESQLLGTDAPIRAAVTNYVQPMTEERARKILDEMNELETDAG